MKHRSSLQKEPMPCRHKPLLMEPGRKVQVGHSGGGLNRNFPKLLLHPNYPALFSFDIFWNVPRSFRSDLTHSTLFLSLYISLYLILPLYLSISLSLYIYLSISLSLYLSISLSLSLSFSLYLSISLSLSLCLSLPLSESRRGASPAASGPSASSAR